MKKRLIVTKIIGTPYCVTYESAQRLHTELITEIEAGKDIELSFVGSKSLTSAFLNVAIGQLYGVFPETKLHDCLTVSKDTDPDDKFLIIQVVQRAKEYFSNPDIFTLSGDNENE